MLATSKERAFILVGVVALFALSVYLLAFPESLPYGHALWPVAILAALACFRPLCLFLNAALFFSRLNSPSWLLLKEIPKRAGHAYVGHASPWTREALERFFEVDERGIKPPPNPRMGDWRIAAVCGKPSPLFQPLPVLNRHKLIVSTTGGGKSRALELDVIQAIQRGDALVVIDPKGDEQLLARVEEECAKHNRKLVFVGLPYPGQSARYNPVANYINAHEIADRISLMLPGQGESQTFKDYAWGVINTVVNGMRMARQEPITLNKIKRHAFGDTWALFEQVIKVRFPRIYERERQNFGRWHSKLDYKSLDGWYLNEKRKSDGIPPSDELDELLKLIVHPREHYQKMVASLWPKLSMMTSGHLRDLLSPESSDPKSPILTWEQVDRNRQVVYFYLGSLLGYTTANAVAAMTILDLISYVGKRYSYQDGVDERRFTIVVDELADVIQPAFTNLLNKSRGANVSIVMAVQSLNDLQAKLGSRAEALRVLANVNTLVQMLAKDQTDAETFAKMTGTVRVRRKRESRHYEPALLDAGMERVSGHRASFAQSEDLVESYLVPPSAVQNLGVGEGFLIQTGVPYFALFPKLPDPAPSSIQNLKKSGLFPSVQPRERQTQVDEEVAV